MDRGFGNRERKWFCFGGIFFLLVLEMNVCVKYTSGYTYGEHFQVFKSWVYTTIQCVLEEYWYGYKGLEKNIWGKH